MAAAASGGAAVVQVLIDEWLFLGAALEAEQRSVGFGPLVIFRWVRSVGFGPLDMALDRSLHLASRARTS